MILVPADAEGFSYTPVHTVAGVSTSATYYEDVRVPVTTWSASSTAAGR